MPNSPVKIEASCADATDPGSLPVSEARQRILDTVQPVSQHEKRAIRSALGRYLGEQVISPLNVPSHTNSAMDGYALHASNLPHEGEQVELEISGTIHAGHTFEGELSGKCCVRIMTGAPMPTGTDTVVMQEQAERVGNNSIRIGAGHREGQNVRQAGEDIAQGGSVFEPGHYLQPADIGILASLGLSEVTVKRKPRVAFFSTGNELRPVGQVLGEGEIYDSNRYSLYAMLQRLGVDSIDLGVVEDNPETLRETLDTASNMADMVITSGGVSVGEADHTRAVLESLGTMDFWRIAMKPGRPLAFGSLGEALFFGLPGNPVAVMVTFYQFVRPAILRLAGAHHWQQHLLKASATSRIRKRPGRYEFHRGIMQGDGQGNYSVAPAGAQGSGILTSMSRANCFIHLPEPSASVDEGDTVLVEPFASFV